MLCTKRSEVIFSDVVFSLRAVFEIEYRSNKKIFASNHYTRLIVPGQGFPYFSFHILEERACLQRCIRDPYAAYVMLSRNQAAFLEIQEAVPL